MSVLSRGRCSSDGHTTRRRPSGPAGPRQLGPPDSLRSVRSGHRPGGTRSLDSVRSVTTWRRPGRWRWGRRPGQAATPLAGRRVPRAVRCVAGPGRGVPVDVHPGGSRRGTPFQDPASLRGGPSGTPAPRPCPIRSALRWGAVLPVVGRPARWRPRQLVVRPSTAASPGEPPGTTNGSQPRSRKRRGSRGPGRANRGELPAQRESRFRRVDGGRQPAPFEPDRVATRCGDGKMDKWPNVRLKASQVIS
jgi:hypothetical protein